MFTLEFPCKPNVFESLKVQPHDIDILSNKEIPEAVRTKIAEVVLISEQRNSDRDLERDKLEVEKRKFIWNTPFVAALAGLLTLSATFIFDRMTAKDDTKNTITLEQVRNELQESVSRLKQELELDTSESLARLEAQAKEREFQYEIVRSELNNDGKTNAERAAVLLFLARAGVLNALDAEALQAMAEEQKDNPEQNIIPQLSSGGRQDVFPPQVQGYYPSNATRQEAKAFSSVYQLVRNPKRPEVFCNGVRISRTHFATMAHCLGGSQAPLDGSLFGLTNLTSHPVGTEVATDFDFLPTSVDYLEPTTSEVDGIAVISASQAGIDVQTTGDWKLKTREPVVGERLFLVGFAPNKFNLSTTRRGLSLILSQPIIHRGCTVTAFGNNRVSTDCISSTGMSGAPIFAESDGALITLAAWGEGDIGPTDGPSAIALSGSRWEP